MEGVAGREHEDLVEPGTRLWVSADGQVNTLYPWSGRQHELALSYQLAVQGGHCLFYLSDRGTGERTGRVPLAKDGFDSAFVAPSTKDQPSLPKILR